MSKKLLLMRHAKSSWKDKSLPDIKRPLKKRGEQAADLIGQTLREAGFTPSLILSSPAKRARQTAEIVAKSSHYKGEIEYVDSLYMGEPADFYARLKELPKDADKVLIVAHNPGLEALLQQLDGHVDTLPTGALALLKLDLKNWIYLDMATSGEMIAFWDPSNVHKGK
jgi:phosphohistidine phosphatase